MKSKWDIKNKQENLGECVYNIASKTLNNIGNPVSKREKWDSENETQLKRERNPNIE